MERDDAQVRPSVTIVTSSYRPKRAPRKKRKQSALTSVIVTPAPLKPIKGPVIRLGAEVSKRFDTPAAQSKRTVIVTPKRTRPSIFGAAPDLTEEEHQHQVDAADALWCELVKRTSGDG